MHYYYFHFLHLTLLHKLHASLVLIEEVTNGVGKRERKERNKSTDAEVKCVDRFVFEKMLWL